MLRRPLHALLLFSLAAGCDSKQTIDYDDVVIAEARIGCRTD
ncbi:MAG: hypothetical protein AB8I08_05990 [Sandaracinaceae bacterium]